MVRGSPYAQVLPNCPTASTTSPMATEHLYINNPLREHASFLNNLFSTHPPIEERIRLLRAM